MEVIGLGADIDKLRASVAALGRDGAAREEPLPVQIQQQVMEVKRPQAVPVQAPQVSDEENRRSMPSKEMRPPTGRR